MVNRQFDERHAERHIGADPVAEALVQAANDQYWLSTRDVFHHDEGVGDTTGPGDPQDREIAALIAEVDAFYGYGGGGGGRCYQEQNKGQTLHSVLTSWIERITSVQLGFLRNMSERHARLRLPVVGGSLSGWVSHN